ncbi:hypothetical protein [Shewanella pneumatophori]|uniref:Solute-binding protein family 3/N-terminal domain-containing protein n=1 Tax=Shewanella pneumatophori TaxID=314092 RepID=A0A9X2CGQ5_9GAMM|nr:hypothetical protein [Shewanella pneumatophori]MCL1137675.1 hypothetical protein [Shewanella pneumatophori]
MSYKSSGLLLASLISLPAMANQANSWEFSGTRYQVSGESPFYSASIERERALKPAQMKSLCRKGLALPLRAKYENKLIAAQLIKAPFSDWPMINLQFELDNIQYHNVTNLTASCSAAIIDSGKSTNLARTGLSYAVAYYTTQQYAAIKPLLPYLMKEPVVSMDGASMITLLLQQQDPVKAEAYFDKYVDITKVESDDIKLWLAQWKMQQEQLTTSLAIVELCKSSNCQQLANDIHDAIDKLEQASADDLSSYF